MTRLTQKDKEQLVQILYEVMSRELLANTTVMKNLTQTVSKKIDALQGRIDKLITTLERYERKQRIIEKKIELIEDYFDPHQHN